MNNTQALLDKARELCSPPTWYRLSKATGIPQPQVSRCIAQGKTLDNKSVWKLAKFIGQDFEQVLSLVEIDRAKKEKDREFWERIAPRVLPSLVVGLLAAAGLRPHTAQANSFVQRQSEEVLQGEPGNQVRIIHTVVNRLRRLTSALFPRKAGQTRYALAFG